MRRLATIALMLAPGCGGTIRPEAPRPYVCGDHMAIARGEDPNGDIADKREREIVAAIAGARMLESITIYECAECDKLAERALEMGY